MLVLSGSDIDFDCDCSCDSVVVLSSDCFVCLFLIFFCPTATCLENGQIIAPPHHNGECKSSAACCQRRSREAKHAKRVQLPCTCDMCDMCDM